MMENNFWKIFEMTGNIEAYLSYVQFKNNSNGVMLKPQDEKSLPKKEKVI